MVEEKYSKIITDFYKNRLKIYDSFDFELFKIKQAFYYDLNDNQYKMFCKYESIIKNKQDKILKQFYEFIILNKK